MRQRIFCFEESSKRTDHNFRIIKNQTRLKHSMTLAEQTKLLMVFLFIAFYATGQGLESKLGNILRTHGVLNTPLLFVIDETVAFACLALVFRERNSKFWYWK